MTRVGSLSLAVAARMPPVRSPTMFASANSSLTAYKDAVQKLASVPIFELRVFAEQKRRHGFLPLTSLSAIGTC